MVAIVTTELNSIYSTQSQEFRRAHGPATYRSFRGGTTDLPQGTKPSNQESVAACNDDKYDADQRQDARSVIVNMILSVVLFYATAVNARIPLIVDASKTTHLACK